MKHFHVCFCLILFALLSGCSSKPQNPGVAKENTQPLEHQHDTVINVMKKDSVPLVYLDEVDFNTVAKWYYAKNYKTDTSNGDIIGLYDSDDYQGEYWDEEFIEMHPFYEEEYTEDGIKKSVFIFEGAYFYLHGHTHCIYDVVFFGEENGRWKFLDTLQLENADINTVESSDLCKKGFSIRMDGEWANMGAVSSRETYWVFQHESIVLNESFWTYSGRFKDEEPYDLVEEGRAKIVIKENPSSDWNTIYYYATNYGCNQKDTEYDLSFCSSKRVYQNGSYKIIPLAKKDQPK